MNAWKRLAAWNWFPPAGKNSAKRRQAGFALDQAPPGVERESPRDEARARFEHEARQALRDWLML